MIEGLLEPLDEDEEKMLIHVMQYFHDYFKSKIESGEGFCKSRTFFLKIKETAQDNGCSDPCEGGDQSAEERVAGFSDMDRGIVNRHNIKAGFRGT